MKKILALLLLCFSLSANSAIVVADRVMETTTTTGTGDITLAGALVSYRTFGSVCSTNDTFRYAIAAVDAVGNPTGDWEVGNGTYSGTNTLTRTTVEASSNGGSAVSFSAGTKRVWLDASAASIIRLSGAFIPTFTLTGTTAITLPTSGTLATTSNKLSAFAATSSSELAGVISDETGSGALVLGTSPALTTPDIGVATATSINKMAITAPATSSTLAVANGKTLTASNTLTLAGTDSTTITFQGTDTYVGRTTTDTLTNKTLTSPTLTTPSLGVATATTINGVTITGSGTIAVGTKTLTASNTLTLAGTDSTTMTFPGVSSNVGYLEIPQNSKSAAYTTVLSDSGKHIYHPSADTTARTWTIDSNANVAYPIGTAITFINDTSAGVITISITSDTMVLMGTGSTGSRTLAAGGIATAVKVTSTRWVISGTGLT